LAAIDKVEETLTITDHSRDSAGLRYVYPVLSRRAGGVSIGVNLNPNNACNWRCVYCQVPDLARGSAPEIDLGLLERELRAFIGRVLRGDSMERQVADGARRIVDVALSGNGEPTSARAFPQVVALVGAVLAETGLAKSVRVRVITNGSLIARAAVLEGLRRLAAMDGEVWFKVDAGTAAGFRRINNVALSPDAVAIRLARCADICATWVQTCVFGWDGKGPDEIALRTYRDLLLQVGVARLRGAHLYGLARPSLQPEAGRLSRLSAEQIEPLAALLRREGLTVTVSP